MCGSGLSCLPLTSLQGPPADILLSPAVAPQVARVETGTAVAALQALAQLSEELKAGSADTALRTPQPSSGAAPVAAPHTAAAARQRRQEKLAEKRRTLSMARSAVLSLTRMTEGLALEAAAAASSAGWSVEGIEAVAGRS